MEAFLNLGNIGQDNRDHYSGGYMGLDDYNIESKIILSRFYNRVKKKARGSRCLLCGKKTDGFCKSHSVPQFSLKYIAESGMVFHPSIFMDIESLDVEKGVMNSGIFQRICRECDGRFFQDYENERNLQKHLTDKILAEICIKNVLYTLDEKIEEKAFYSEIIKEIEFNADYGYIEKSVNNAIKKFEDELCFYKSILQSPSENPFRIIFYEVLPYRVPLAAQCLLSPSHDLWNNEINDLAEIHSDKLQILHLLVLPLKSTSVILLFYHSKDAVYRQLQNQFNILSYEKKLQYINYLIFAYSSNYFISKSISSEILQSKKLHALAKEIDGRPNWGQITIEDLIFHSYIPIEMDEIPNFLTKELAAD